MDLKLLRTEGSPKKRQAPDTFKLWALYARVYEVEMGREYGRMPRDFGDAKKWLELYPDFFESETMAMRFQEAAVNYMRSADKFWKEQHFPMFGLLMQYNKFIPAKKREAQSMITHWETCPDCLGEYVKGTEHTCKV